MATKSDSEFILDGIGALPDGMNSGIVPQLLQKTQVSFATNCTFRGGFIRNRPGLRRVNLSFSDDATQVAFEQSLFQGAAFFKSEYGAESIVASIGGRLFDIFPSTSSNTAEIEEVTIPGDPNSSGNVIAWMWQAERWMIINDGQSLPIFYDGATSRRSYGPSREVGEVAVVFNAPAIGSDITITLTDIYSGPFNQTIWIGDYFFQVNSGSASGYAVTLKNLSAASGTSIPSSSQLLFPSNLITQLSQDALPVLLSLKLTVPPLDEAISASSTIAIHLSGEEYVTGNARANLLGSPTDVPAGSTVFYLGFTNGLTPPPQHSPVYLGYVEGSSPTGMETQSGFVAPAVGASVNTFLRVPYLGPLPATVVIGNELFEITAADAIPVPSNEISVRNINAPEGTEIAVSTILETIAELPVSRMGAYGLGRNWVSLPDGRSFIGSDIVGGSSGTPALNNRDAVLHTTENDYLFGGGAFVVPGNVGDIRAMVFTATLDVSLGQGPLQIGTPTSFFSCMAPVDRTVWQFTTNPILTQSLIGKGPLGQYGTILVNSDTLYRARDGIGSLILARRDFTAWGNVPISREMQKVIDEDDQALLENSTAVQFDNRLLMGCLPFQSPLGVFHQGFIALNFDPVSSLRGKQASIYDGLWTGIQAFQFVTGQFRGDERSFAFCYNSFSNKIELFEILQSGEGELDNGNSPLTWSFETASLFLGSKGKGPFDVIKLMDGEIYISDLQGAASVQVWFRPDYSECWTPWHTFGICASPGVKQYRSRIGLGVPDITKCDPTTNRPFCVGNNFQVRVQITGACKVMGILLKAVPEQETKYSVPICKPLCDSRGLTEDCEPCREQGECQTFPMVFYNLNANKSYSNATLSFQVECPDGSSRTVYIAPGRLNFTLPFPPEFDGVYPPLIMGCEAGGLIIRNVPTGATQENIDAIVDEMFQVCGRAIAESEVQCTEAPQAFSNQAVYFDHPCESGVLTYSGTLPSWITIDTENSRLVGAAGTLNGNTQENANALAHSALDAFANTAIDEGDLTCEVTPGDCPIPDEPSVEISLIPTTSDPLNMAIDTVNGRLWVIVKNDSEGLASDKTIYIIKIPENTLEDTIDTSLSDGADDIVYDSVNACFGVLMRNGDYVFFNPDTFTEISRVVAAVAANGPVGGIAFDYTRGRHFVIDLLALFTTTSSLIDGASKSIITTEEYGANLNGVVFSSVLDGYLISDYNSADPNVKHIDPDTLSMSASAITFPVGDETAYIMVENPDTGIVYAATREGTTRKRVRIINPVTLSIGTLTGADVPSPNWSLLGIAVDRCDGSVWTSGTDRVLRFEGAGGTQVGPQYVIPDDPENQGTYIIHSSQTNYAYFGIASFDIAFPAKIVAKYEL